MEVEEIERREGGEIREGGKQGEDLGKSNRGYGEE